MCKCMFSIICDCYMFDIVHKKRLADYINRQALYKVLYITACTVSLPIISSGNDDGDVVK